MSICFSMLLYFFIFYSWLLNINRVRVTKVSSVRVVLEKIRKLATFRGGRIVLVERRFKHLTISELATQVQIPVVVWKA